MGGTDLQSGLNQCLSGTPFMGGLFYGCGKEGRKEPPDTVSCIRGFSTYQSVNGIEHILGRTAEGAAPIIGELLEGGAGSDAVLGIADSRIIDIAAQAALIFHKKTTFLFRHPEVRNAIN